MDAEHDGVGVAIEAMLDPEHPLKVEAAEWAEENLRVSDMVERERGSTFFREGWRRCADHGIQAAAVGPEYGGTGLGVAEKLLLFEGLGFGANDHGLVFGLSCQTWTVMAALDAAADEAQRERLYPALADGSLIGAFAMTEPDSGSDSSALATTATRTDDGYVLDGRKAYITMAPVADVVIVFATVDPGLGRWGITAFVVDTDRSGVDIAQAHEKMGLRTTPFGNVVLDHVEVPESARLGAEGSGAAIFNTVVESERAFLFAVQIGRLERQLRDTVARAGDRHQFGVPIGDFQAVSHRVADMACRHEHARLLLYKTAALSERGRPVRETAAMTKLAASEGAVASGLDALLVHGAEGYLSETGVERGVRDAIGGLLYSGTSDIQRNLIAGLRGVGR